jgi:hypothetical protein
MWGDKMTQWGPVWTQTNEFFSQKYGFFIKSIQLPIPDATARRNAEAARRDWERASNTLSNGVRGLYRFTGMSLTRINRACLQIDSFPMTSGTPNLMAGR